jgi:transposase
MPKIKYIINLSEQEKQKLKAIENNPKTKPRAQKRARILLLCEKYPKWSIEQIAQALICSKSMVNKTKKNCIEQGVMECLTDKKRNRVYERSLDAKGEAMLVTLACSTPPEGRSVWTMQLLADELIELNCVETISDETVRRTLKKNEIKPWQKQSWVIPPTYDAEYVHKMEDVLDIYAKILPEDEMLICMDESTKQHIEDKREPIPTQKGQALKYDYEYIRHGVSSLFIFFSPDESWRKVMIDDYKRTIEWVHHMKTISDEFPQKRKIHVVLDNFKTHNPAKFYEYFEPKIARELIQKFEFHFTPKHASWLNMAEIEFSALFSQALNKRIPSQEQLKKEVLAWETYRNQHTKSIDWKFTTSDARTRLKKLYPSIVSI